TYRPKDASPVARDSESLREALAQRSAAPLDPTPPRQAIAAPVVRARAVAERVEFDVHVFRTESGLPVLVRRKPGAHIVHAGLFALGGARDEGADRAGLTKLLVRASLKGTANRNAVRLAEEIELLGGTMRSSAGSESFGWATSVPTRHLAAALEL